GRAVRADAGARRSRLVATGLPRHGTGDRAGARRVGAQPNPANRYRPGPGRGHAARAAAPASGHAVRRGRGLAALPFYSATPGCAPERTAHGPIPANA